MYVLYSDPNFIIFQFMKTPTRHRRKGVTVEEHEEHVISILVTIQFIGSHL